MRFLILLAILALGAFATEINTDVNLNTQPGTSTKFKVTTTHTKTVQERPLGTQMSSGPSAELNTQMDTGNQQMSAQAETHNRARRWGYYGGYGGMGYGGMGWGRPWGMGMYGMRGMGYGYPMWG
ncbi:hypothetical protein L5515_002439 [Caenorhabditis briggsae]|uniref:Uncharacterized protein n=1 Tax=Caenorhabditis briggsae TaxID=6238 RepID=A0AAE9E820_CAEBR|nr:hypothetical protein L5515_002439 [Caenorhabditis briggsae]